MDEKSVLGQFEGMLGHLEKMLDPIEVSGKSIDIVREMSLEDAVLFSKSLQLLTTVILSGLIKNKTQLESNSQDVFEKEQEFKKEQETIRMSIIVMKIRAMIDILVENA